MRPRNLRLVASSIALITILSMFLAACGSSSAAQSGVTTVTWWSWNPPTTLAPALVDQFNATHPNIKLTYKWLTYTPDYLNTLKLAMASGTGPDIFGVQSGSMAQQYDQFMEDLTPLEQKANGANWQDSFFSLGLSQFQSGSRTQALPLTIGAAGYLWYNKTIFDQYGLTPPKTLSDWVAVSQALKAKGITPFVQGAKDGWQDEDMFISFASSIAPGKLYDAIAGKISFTDPDLVQAMETWKSLFSDGIMQNGALGTSAYPDAANQFISGKAAMILLGTWNNGDVITKTGLAAQQKALGFTQAYEYLPVLVPQVGSYPTRLFGGPDVGLAINKASPNKDAAWQVIQWMEAANGGQKWAASTLSDLPAIKAAVIPDGIVNTPAEQASFQQQLTDLANAGGYRNIPYPSLDTGLINALQNVASGQQTPMQAMQGLQQISQGISR